MTIFNNSNTATAARGRGGDRQTQRAWLPRVEQRGGTNSGLSLWLVVPRLAWGAPPK